MRVVVLMGGPSAEREISLRSGKAVADALRSLGYEVFTLDLAPDVCQRLLEIRPDKVFIALHGPYGEDGRLQGLLDILGIPYVGSGHLGSAIAMDKDISKKILSYHGIPTPRWICVRDKDIDWDWEDFPAVVKPSDQGSSVGLYIVNSPEQLKDAVKECLKLTKKVLVEEFIDGVDVTVGILMGKPLPPIEIRPRKGVYDYESKYTKGMTEYVFLEDDKLIEELQDLALNVFEVLELKDLARIDFRVSKEGKAYFLEANTIPGMTELSLFPMACQKAGIGFERMVEMLLGEG
ncbi:D-alanine--D-alanine ligase family protein [Thermocrinis minervae]|uniref:D-alanine--D-alanine ligase n=1 Tax=Thermocrinis minervae TaxID=381751 RepID=A0A1M6T448_9AQUI|nr:D-alanine--D-alanine ligase [Thermocrinis minervae]SHK51765.1 D-alanine--D-alanine ligase [Thermocrinis minervae]